jgi:hypothetical protein
MHLSQIMISLAFSSREIRWQVKIYLEKHSEVRGQESLSKLGQGLIRASKGKKWHSVTVGGLNMQSLILTIF